MKIVEPGRYDERQLVVRGRIGLTSFALTLVVIMLNGIYNDIEGQWADVYTQSTVIFWLMFSVFSLWAISKGAFFSSSRQRLRFVLLSTVIALLLAVLLVVKGLNYADFPLSSTAAGIGMLLVAIVGWFSVVRDHAAERSLDDE